MSVVINSGNNKEFAEIYQAAHMYYEMNMRQSEIAAKLYLSPAKVSRLLQQAKEVGIVEIRVRPVLDRLEPMERILCGSLGLKDAIVVTDYDEKLEIMEDALAEYAVHYLEEHLHGSHILGVTNGRSVNSVLERLQLPADCSLEIVQLMGATSNSYSKQDTNLILSHLTAKRPDCVFYPLTIPLYLNDLYFKEVLMQDDMVRPVLKKMKQSDIILTGISKLEHSSDIHLTWQGQMSPHHFEELAERGAVGSICAQYFDRCGHRVNSEWNAKCLAMPLGELSRVQIRIGIAQGLDKVEAILGALRGHYINVLITDANTASDLIELNKKLKKQ